MQTWNAIMISATRKLNRSGFISALNGRLRTSGFVESWHAEWSTTIDQLLGFHQLQSNWDGEGATRPRSELLQSALQLALQFRDDVANPFPPPSRVLPGIEGTIIVEWQWPESFIELEVIEPGRAQSMQISGSEPAFHCMLI